MKTLNNIWTSARRAVAGWLYCFGRRWRIVKHRGRYKIQRRTCLVCWVNLCRAVHPPAVEWYDTVKAAEARIEELKNQDKENTQCVVGYYN